MERRGSNSGKILMVVSGVVFLFSGVVLVLALTATTLLYQSRPDPNNVSNPPGVDKPAQQGNSAFVAAVVGAVGSAVTSVASLLGMIFGWRKEKREAIKNDLEIRRLELELEKVRAAAAEKDAPKPAPKRKRDR